MCGNAVKACIASKNCCRSFTCEKRTGLMKGAFEKIKQKEAWL
jgi:hypothetical protein